MQIEYNDKLPLKMNNDNYSTYSTMTLNSAVSFDTFGEARSFSRTANVWAKNDLNFRKFQQKAVTENGIKKYKVFRTN